MDDHDRLSLVLAELERIPGKKIKRPTTTTMLCPFHSERTPSGFVKHDLMKPRSIGFFKCRGCGQEMGWNEFAARTSLTPFVKVTELEVPKHSFDHLDKALLEDEPELVKEDMILSPLNRRAQEFLGLPKPVWRTFPFEFLTRIGAMCAYHQFRDRYFVYLPVMVNGVLRGYIKATPSKEKPSYLNAPGKWSHTRGLFPYDYAVELMRKRKLTTMVLVEGPRDALRLLYNDIPAICILGTQSWSPTKVRTLELADIENIIIATDGDEAGKLAAAMLYSGTRKVPKPDGTVELVLVAPALKDVFSTYGFPWEDYESVANLKPGEKIDPGNAPQEAIDDLAKLLT